MTGKFEVSECLNGKHRTEYDATITGYVDAGGHISTEIAMLHAQDTTPIITVKLADIETVEALADLLNHYLMNARATQAIAERHEAARK